MEIEAAKVGSIKQIPINKSRSLSFLSRVIDASSTSCSIPRL